MVVLTRGADMNELAEMKERIQKLNELIQGSDNVVFFGGAGVSARRITRL